MKKLRCTVIITCGEIIRMEMVEKGKTETIGSRGPRKGISDEGKFHKRIME
jgi:hypothetical protein